MLEQEFGEYMKGIRKFAGLTLAELGEMVNLSHSYLSQIETGKKSIPSPDVLRKLADALGVTYQELMVKAGHITYMDWFKNSKELEEYSELFYPEMLGYPSREAYLAEILTFRDELTHVLNRVQTTYNGHQLTDQDRRRVVLVLEQLFPEYQRQQ